MPEKNTADLIQSVLEKNKGFMTVKRLADSIGAEGRYALGIKKGDSGKIIQRKIEQSEPGRFMFRAKGNRIYILEPSEPSELVLGLLSEKKAFDTKIIGSLPYTSTEFYAVVNELVDDGRVIIKVSGSFTPKIYRAGEIVRAAISENNTESESAGEYTPEKFREAFENSDKGRTFVRVFRMRRYLRWPREVFDSMVMTLLRQGKIFVHPAEPTVLTPDEYEDSFRDEFGDMNGTVTWND